MKFKKRNVKLFIFVTTILFFINTLVLLLFFFGLIENDVEVQAFEFPKENTMTPKPLPSENTMIPKPHIK